MGAIEAEPDRVAEALPAADPGLVFEAIEQDPARVAAAIGDSLDPTPSELSSELDTVKSNLDTVNSELTDVCSQLLLEEALAGVYSC